MSTPSNGPQDPHPGRVGPPAALVTAASLAGVEALLLLGQGIAAMTAVSTERLTMGLTTAAFFVLYAAGLGLCAWALAGCRSWARAPVVMAQLIQLLLAWSFLGGSTTWVAVGLAVLAVATLVGIFHPASLDALSDERG